MNLEDQVCSVELAKKLKELGIPQSSLFFWTIAGVASRLDVLPILETNYSAFTVSELLEILPITLNGNDFQIIILSSAHGKYWRVRYKSLEIPQDTYIEEHDFKLENACAKMLIYLIENNLLEIK